MKRAVLQLPISERKNNGAIAQLVEHRTENPCVPGSNPGGTTKRGSDVITSSFLVLCSHYKWSSDFGMSAKKLNYCHTSSHNEEKKQIIMPLLAR